MGLSMAGSPGKSLGSHLPLGLISQEICRCLAHGIVGYYISWSNAAVMGGAWLTEAVSMADDGRVHG